MKILLVEPFYTGSHKQWVDSLMSYSAHQIQLISLPGVHWKWRMHGGAIALRQALSYSDEFDLILTSDMLDLSLFKSLLPSQLREVPIIHYFHENQLTYPWSSTDHDVKLNRDNHYAFINYSSALVADRVAFNSQYHLKTFIEALPLFLEQFPDFLSKNTIEEIEDKSEVCYVGVDVKSKERSHNNVPVLLWNHRWEEDKNPKAFFEALFRLKKEGVDFNLVVLGEGFAKQPKVFGKAREHLSDEIIHWGFVDDLEEYWTLLAKSDILPVTSNQEFFGISVMEAVKMGLEPLLPLRLTYPELYGDHFGKAHFYDEGEEMYYKLKALIFAKSNLEAKKVSFSLYDRFDWINMAQDYDKLFERTLENKLN